MTIKMRLVARVALAILLIGIVLDGNWDGPTLSGCEARIETTR